MQFPNAHDGVKKIYSAEIMALIGAILVIVVGIIGVVGSKVTDDTTTGVLGIAILGLSLATGLLMLISFIMNLIGLNQARKDENAFATALIIAVIGIAVSLLGSALAKNDLVSSLCDTVNSICQVLITLYVLAGIVNLAKKLGDTAMVEKGTRIRTLIAVLWIVAILLGVVATVFQTNETAGTIIGVLGIASGIVSIIAYLMYLSYLSKSVKMLAK